MQGALLASLSRVAKRCRTFALRLFSAKQTIMFYIVTLVKSLHMPWYRSSIRVVDVNALQQQQRYSTATLSAAAPFV
jgi:hypothetical protein